MGFPTVRMRRLRTTRAWREMLRETVIDPADFIYPLFVVHGHGVREPIEAMPGVYHLSVDTLREEVGKATDAGIKAVLLFGVAEHKDAEAHEAWDDEGIVQTAIRALKAQFPDLVVMTDVCLCGYTDHGHCGLVVDGRIDNDSTLAVLADVALSHARAGADVVAPSDMMDGRVGAIRQALDRQGFSETAIMAYSAKYASAFYGPFREAAHSAPQFGDRRTYQMDPASRRQAIREVALDIDEGADVVMVKPALAYLDVIREVRDRFEVPLAAYNVSGEYAMVKAAAAAGWVDERAVVGEILTGIKRAGADLIITYHAVDAAQWLRRGDL